MRARKICYLSGVFSAMLLMVITTICASAYLFKGDLWSRTFKTSLMDVRWYALEQGSDSISETGGLQDGFNVTFRAEGATIVSGDFSTNRSGMNWEWKLKKPLWSCREFMPDKGCMTGLKQVEIWRKCNCPEKLKSCLYWSGNRSPFTAMDLMRLWHGKNIAFVGDLSTMQAVHALHCLVKWQVDRVDGLILQDFSTMDICDLQTELARCRRCSCRYLESVSFRVHGFLNFSVTALHMNVPFRSSGLQQPEAGTNLNYTFGMHSSCRETNPACPKICAIKRIRKTKKTIPFSCALGNDLDGFAQRLDFEHLVTKVFDITVVQFGHYFKSAEDLRDYFKYLVKLIHIAGPRRILISELFPGHFNASGGLREMIPSRTKCACSLRHTNTLENWKLFVLWDELKHANLSDHVLQITDIYSSWGFLVRFYGFLSKVGCDCILMKDNPGAFLPFVDALVEKLKPWLNPRV